MSTSEMKIGVFKKEIKNRFLCTVNIDGIDTICYIPSSCRLSNFIDLENKMVMLQPVKKKNARTKYSVYALKYRRSYVPLNLSGANHIIGDNLNKRMFSFLGSRKQIRREKTVEGYKSDLYIEDTDTIVEIKSVLSLRPTAFFPTVFSERAIRQLEELKRLLTCGHKVCYMFVSMYSGVKNICIEKNQERYLKILKECIDLGMTVCAFSIGIKKGAPTIKSQIDLQV